MERILARDIGSYENAEVMVSGWVHRVRNLGGVSFIILRDRSGLLQLVTSEGDLPSQESIVRAVGTVVAAEKATSGYEVHVSRWEVLSVADTPLPIAVAEEGAAVPLDTRLDNRSLSLRRSSEQTMIRVASTVLAAFSASLRRRDFTEIKTSKLVSSGTEGGTGLFSVDYFDQKVYLAQSPQFYKQTAVASGLERVFEVGAAYRAEKHETTRHLNEYVSLDVEMGFIDSEHTLMDLEVAILQEVVHEVNDLHGADISRLGSSLPSSGQLAAIPRITYDDAKARIKERTGSRVFEITPDGERALCDWASETADVEAVFVYGFPRRKRPFYALPDGNSTRSFDLLFRGIEITTGGLRIHRAGELVDSMEKFGLDPSQMEDYLAVFRYGCPPHGGFAIGLERFVSRLLGLANVREASLFPRDRRRVRP